MLQAMQSKSLPELRKAHDVALDEYIAATDEMRVAQEQKNLADSVARAARDRLSEASKRVEAARKALDEHVAEQMRGY